MKTLVVFYSYTGKTRKLATSLTSEENADILELKDEKRPSTIGAYVAGSLAARRQKQAKLKPFDKDLSSYDRLVIAVPMWAQYPAPAFNNIVAALPAGKRVEIVMTSGSGSSGGNRGRMEAALKEKGCTLAAFRDIKASDIV